MYAPEHVRTAADRKCLEPANDPALDSQEGACGDDTDGIQRGLFLWPVAVLCVIAMASCAAAVGLL